MKRILERIKNKPYLWLYLRVTFVFTLLFTALAAKALFTIIAVESNPFFYANF